MPDNAFYVYGVVRFSVDLDWQEKGIAEKDTYMISEGNFGALVHDCEEKPYPTEDIIQIKEMIIAHNRILDRAVKDFAGVIPLPFNTIIKNGTDSAQINLKKWLHDDQERLERIWNKIKGKKEYGLRIYYNKNKLLEEVSADKEIEKNKKDAESKTPGLSYLLQGKVESKKQKIFQNKVNELKKEFYEKIKRAAEEIAVNPPKISLEEEKDLLLGLSVLVEEKKLTQIKEILEKNEGDFSFNLAGPFAPYSFVENGK